MAQPQGRAGTEVGKRMRLKKITSAVLAASVVVAVISLGLRNRFGVSAASAASGGSDFSLVRATATITHETITNANCTSEIASLATSYAYRPWTYSANASVNSPIVSCDNPAWYSDSFDIRAKLRVYDKKDFKADITGQPLMVFLSPLPCSQAAISPSSMGLLTVLPAVTVKKRQSSSIVYQSEANSLTTNVNGPSYPPAPALLSPMRLQVSVAYQGKLGHLRIEGSGDLCEINNQPMSLTILSGIFSNDGLQDAALNDTDEACVDIASPVFKTHDVTSSVCPALFLARPPV